MTSSEVNQALLEPKEEDFESKNESQGSEKESQGMGVETKVDFRQVIDTVKQLKSLEVLKSTLTIFTSNFKLMFFMLLSVVPLFAFMVFYDIRLQKALLVAPMVLDEPLGMRVRVINLSNSDALVSAMDDDDYSQHNKRKTEFYTDVFLLCVLYMIVYPIVELYSMAATMKIAAKVHAGEKQATFKEVFCQISNLKGPCITYLYVHLLSSLNLLGLFWVVINHTIYSGRFNPYAWTRYNLYGYIDFWSIEFFIYVLYTAVHIAIFIALVYAYLGWSAFWNMGIVISVLGEEAGIGAFGLADYYGKHCRPTGFQLMLGFVAFSTVLRLPYLFAAVINRSAVGVLVTSVVAGLVCFSYLVKWAAFVLYFHDCKERTMEKKNDQQVGKADNAV